MLLVVAVQLKMNKNFSLNNSPRPSYSFEELLAVEWFIFIFLSWLIFHSFIYDQIDARLLHNFPSNLIF